LALGSVLAGGGLARTDATPTLAWHTPSTSDDSDSLGPAIVESFEDDCRACHDSGVPDRHHSLYGQLVAQDSVVPYPDANGDGTADATYGCLNCHGPSFTVVRNCVACHTSPVGTVPDGTNLAEDPLTLTLTAFDALTLSWDDSCDGGPDTDYAVYEGSLGDFTDHTPIVCSTEGATSATFAPPADDAYYLVVARNHWSEGSYGIDGDGTQRPPSTSACLAQSIGCPWH
jgi:hypothetical protein